MVRLRAQAGPARASEAGAKENTGLLVANSYALAGLASSPTSAEGQRSPPSW